MVSKEAVTFLWEDCDPVFRQLFLQGLRPIVVGGQAVNLWVDHYSRSYSEFSAPVASKDIDVIGDLALAQRCAQVLKGCCKAVDRTKSAVTMSAVVMLGEDENALRIDFQDGSAPNDLDEIERDAIPLPTQWGEVKVMHPLHCLKTRVFNVLEIWHKSEKKYDNARGLAQLRASIDVVRYFARDRLQAPGGTRKVLNLYEEIFKFSRSSLGEKLWQAKQIDVFSCVEPHDALPERFRIVRYAQMQKVLAR